MARPKRCRRVLSEPTATSFEPLGIPQGALGEVEVSWDELEALRLADLQGLYQEAAAEHMGLSRQTFGRLVADARRKVAGALVQGRSIHIVGGPCELASSPQEGEIMKVAVALNEHGGISNHFGRSATFRVYQLQDGARLGEETRENTHRARGRGRGASDHGPDQPSQGRGRRHGHCGGHERQQGGHNCGESHGRGGQCGGGHEWVSRALGDCSALIAAGMGAGAASALHAAGVRPIVVESSFEPEQAVELFQEGKL